MLGLAGLNRRSDQIQSGPGQIGVLNSDWLSAWDAVDAVGARRSGDALLGHASLIQLTCLFQADSQPPWEANYDWSLTQAASPGQPPEMENYDWMLGHTVSPFQPSRKENYDWLLTQAASPFSYAAVSSVEAYGARSGAAYFPCRRLECRDLLKVQGKLGHRDLEREGERDRESN